MAAGRRLPLFVAIAFCIVIAGTAAQEPSDSEIVSAPGAPNVFRLPEHIHPLHYKLRIVTHLDDEEGFKFTGKVWIKVSARDVE